LLDSIRVTAVPTDIRSTYTTVVYKSIHRALEAVRDCLSDDTVSYIEVKWESADTNVADLNSASLLTAEDAAMESSTHSPSTSSTQLDFSSGPSAA